MKIHIDVRAGQRHDQGRPGMLPAETLHRIGALPGMKSHQEIDRPSFITLSENDFVAKISEDLPPAHGSDAVPVPQSWLCRSDNINLHTSIDSPEESTAHRCEILPRRHTGRACKNYATYFE